MSKKKKSDLTTQPPPSRFLSHLINPTNLSLPNLSTRTNKEPIPQREVHFPEKKKCMQKNFFSFPCLVSFPFFLIFSFLINDDTHDDTFRYTISLFNLIFIIALFFLLFCRSELILIFV